MSNDLNNNNMPAPKGHPRYGGRQAGVKNTLTPDLRGWIFAHLCDSRAQFMLDMEQLQPYQRVLIFEKLLSYVVPKVHSVQTQVEFNSLDETQLDSIIHQLNG